MLTMLSSYTLTFLLLVSEMATFLVLIFPLPHTVRKKLFHFLSESPIVAKLAYGVKIAFMYVLCRPCQDDASDAPQIRSYPICGRAAEDVESHCGSRPRQVNRGRDA